MKVKAESDKDKKVLIRDLPIGERNKVREHIRLYSVPMLISDGDDSEFNFPCSGTLCKIDQYYGIVTARHVWARERLGIKYHQEVKISIGKGPHTLKREFLEPIGPSVHGTIYDCEIPDVVFIPLSIVTASSLQALGNKLFYPIDKRLTDQEYNSNSDYGLFAIFGTPDRLLDKKRGVVVVPSFTYFSEFKEKKEKDGWDYLELDVDLMDVTLDGKEQMPESLEGISGGGIWCIKFSMDPRFTIENFNRDIIFAGVSFCQTDVKDKHRRIIGHGPKSIYENLLSWVRNLYPNSL